MMIRSDDGDDASVSWWEEGLGVVVCGRDDDGVVSLLLRLVGGPSSWCWLVVFVGCC